ncbi:DNA repair protein SWI5 homolog [Otolemur garnettii]|uniref:DNA repair protein SWI5 homolog n=1 Tax=Otolemur garnettii TaxID=30611 RepID=UPI0006442F86|nr:DNA repair protein SWI5 homolog [Otolemur garnettii]
MKGKGAWPGSDRGLLQGILVPEGPEKPLSGTALDPLAPLNPPPRGPRTPGLRRFLSRAEPGLNRSYRGTFRSPQPSPKPGQADGTGEESLLLDIQKLKEKEDMLDKEISQLISEGYSVDELEDHIAQLHEYNDIKDIGQMLLGKLGEQQNPRGATRVQEASLSLGVLDFLLW